MAFLYQLEGDESPITFASAARHRTDGAQPPCNRADEETAIFDYMSVAHEARGERRDDFATVIGEVLRLGWRGQFRPARSVLVALRDTPGSSSGERALCDALLALASVAVGEPRGARQLLRQALCKPAASSHGMPEAELRWLRLARALAVQAGALVGNRKRPRAAAHAKFLGRDPDSAWLIAWRAGWSWRDAPSAVQPYARYVEAVRQVGARRPLLLSAAEAQIFEHLATGASVSRVARVLQRSVHTVRTHLRNAYTKLDVHDRDEALAKAREIGFLGDAGVTRLWVMSTRTTTSRCCRSQQN